MWQTSLEVEGKDETIISLYLLLATNFAGLVINHLLEGFHLPRGQNSPALSGVSCLVDDDNSRAPLGLHETSSCDKRNVHNAVVVDAFNVDCPARLVEHAEVLSSNASVGASVNEGTLSDLPVVGGFVDDVLVDFKISLSIYVHFF